MHLGNLPHGALPLPSNVSADVIAARPVPALHGSNPFEGIHLPPQDLNDPLAAGMSSNNHHRTQTLMDKVAVHCNTDILRFEFVQARDSLPKNQRAFLSLHSVRDYQTYGAELFLTDCRNGGFALCGSELISVFSAPKAKLGNFLVTSAIERGATSLTCFDTSDILPRFYRKFGFEIVASVAWNPAYAPVDWDYALGGTPNVVQMKLVNKKK